MKQFLIVVDMQKDLVDGALGTAEAQAIVPAVAEKIRAFVGEIIVTYDTHEEDYMTTREGRFLSVPHCIRDTDGWQLNDTVAEALSDRAYTVVEKPTFGAVTLPEVVEQLAGDEDFTVELIGLCTDICVVSNAMILKANFPEVDMTVDAACCAGVTPASHQAALTTMACCQITISNN
ncbi:MAG: cysteine hydrolase [Oscillospiraceae bacterium]|nr:cysteine hydrolase [Oscillospiraceae bacterium]